MKNSKTRELIKELYLNALKEEQLPWRKGWHNSYALHNGASKHKYRGINKLLLSYISQMEGYTDPRFYTFNQIKEMKLHLSKESKGKGIPVEFWTLYDLDNKKTMSIQQYEDAIAKDKENPPNVRWMVRNYYVFNARYIDGLEEYKVNEKKVLPTLQKEFVDTLIKNMEVDYVESRLSDRAYYSPNEDKVVVPSYNSFLTDEDYYSTILHELSHATGHESRLNRPFGGIFGSESYTKEELRAEIASSFITSEIGLLSDAGMDNHKAYIQSWIKIIEEKDNELFKAIADADSICEYLKDNGELNRLLEHEAVQGEDVQISGIENMIEKAQDAAAKNRDTQTRKTQEQVR